MVYENNDYSSPTKDISMTQKLGYRKHSCANAYEVGSARNSQVVVKVASARIRRELFE